jgi:protein phosphatase
MKILSAVHWQANSPDSLVLKQADARKGSLVLALVCEGIMPKEGEVASGFVAEEMLKWFDSNLLPVICRNKSLFWLKRSLLAALQQALEELSLYSSKKNFACQTSAALILLWRKKYVIFQWGATKAYRCRRKIKPLHFDQPSQRLPSPGFPAGKQEQAPYTRFGKVRSGDCYLICSEGFRRMVNDIQLCEALRTSRFINEKQLAKRLAGIAQYSGQKEGYGSATMTAVMMRIV